MTATTSTEAPSGAQQDKAGAKAIGTLLTGAEDTAAHQPEQKKSSTKWLRPFLKPVMPSFREVAVVSFFVNLAALATPVFVMQVYDRVVFHKGMSTLLGLAIGMAFMLTFDFILRQARSRIMQTVALRMEAQVARSLFAKVNALPLKILEGRPAEFWHLLFRDVDVVRNTLSGPSAVLVVDVPFSILFMAVIFILAPPLAWVLVVALVIFLTLAILSGRAVQSAADAEKESTIGRDGLLAEVLRGRATVKALSLGDAIRPHWEGKVAGQVERSIHRGGRTDMFSNLAMVMTIGTSVGMTVVGALAIMEQNLTIGGLIAANMMAGRLLSPLGQLVGAWRSYAAFGQSVKRLGEAFSLPEDREETLAAHPRPRGEVAAEEVVVSYPRASKPALKGVTCGFLPGGMTAILGTNGSGKSTLLKTLQ
ncbi:MAG: ABC transporter transmembrane domain-containing protein, partial [Rhodospirillaceae bacterium]